MNGRDNRRFGESWGSCTRGFARGDYLSVMPRASTSVSSIYSDVDQELVTPGFGPWQSAVAAKVGFGFGFGLDGYLESEGGWTKEEYAGCVFVRVEERYGLGRGGGEPEFQERTEIRGLGAWEASWWRFFRGRFLYSAC